MQGTWLQLRRLVQILFPLGHLATKNPKTAPAGMAMMAGVALADAAGYLGYGGLMFYRTVVYPRD